MSTVIQRTISLRPINKLNMDNKHRLVRKSSMDKIKRFNSFICSQQYVILPALLSWLRYSQSGLQSSAEHTIHLFRSIFFNNLIHKLLSSDFKTGEAWTSKKFQISAKKNVTCDITNISLMFAEFCDAIFLLTIVVYTSFILVVIQLGVLLYTIYTIWMPSGFIFLLGCMLIIKYLFYKTACACITKAQKGLIK